MVMMCSPAPAPARPCAISIGGLGRARDLRGDVLPLDADLVAQRQHDGADHRDQQDQARGLEEVDVARVEHAAERRGVG